MASSYPIPQPTIFYEAPLSSGCRPVPVHAASEDIWDTLHSTFTPFFVPFGGKVAIEITLARTEPPYLSRFWDVPFGWWMPIADKAAWNRTWKAFRQVSTPTPVPFCRMSHSPRDSRCMLHVERKTPPKKQTYILQLFRVSTILWSPASLVKGPVPTFN